MTTMTISAQQVQKLREITGAGILDCKKALETSGGDYDKAIQFLREKGKASAAQKAGRTASDGLVCSWISADSRKGSLVEVNCETDFVARTGEFQDLVKKLASQAGETQVRSAEQLKTQQLKGSCDTVESFIKEKIGKLGENLRLHRAVAFGGPESLVIHYIHQPVPGAAECGKLGVLLEVKTQKDTAEVREFMKELAMQVAAANPKWVSKDNVPADVVEKEKAIYVEQCKQSGKPEAAWPKIIDGKFKDFLKQFCLTEQAHIRDSSGKTIIQSLIQQVSEKAGGPILVQNFVRFKVGEE